MKRTPMFLMLLLATALSDSQTSGAVRSTKPLPGTDSAGLALQGADNDSSALDEAHRAALRRIKPAA